MSIIRNTGSRWWLLLSGFIALVLVLALGAVALRKSAIEERIRKSVVHELARRYQSDVELDAIHIKGFPGRPTVTGTGLSLRHHGRTDVPPLIHIGSFSFSISLWDLLRPIRHIREVRVEHMIMTVPPRHSSKEVSAVAPPMGKSIVSAIIVDRIICADADIVILPKKADRAPLDWNIHRLDLTSVGVNRPFAFSATLTNGKPVGEIATHGQFGPWDGEEPGNSPVSGEYEFTNADLGPFPGIAGILSSTGGYAGALSELQVKGETDTPDFSLDRVGKPIPLHTDYSATVDGMNGDTLLHSVRAILGESLIIAKGSVVHATQQKGHFIRIEATVPKGRIEDFLSLAINSDKPFMTGPVKLKAALILPPGKTKALDKMILDGEFGIVDANWSNPELREKLESLSRHALGTPNDMNTGQSVTDLTGQFHLENGLIRFNKLNFSVEGATIQLAGSYSIRDSSLDFSGDLRLQAKLSQTLTGPKSMLVKAFDPFFNKEGAGTVLPIRIAGTRMNPIFGVSIFHKTFKKQIAQNKSNPTGEAGAQNKP